MNVTSSNPGVPWSNEIYIATPRGAQGSPQEPYMRVAPQIFDEASIAELLRSHVRVRIQETLLRLEGVTPGARLARATALARQKINELREVVQLSQVPEAEMVVAYLEDEAYRYIHTMAVGRESDESSLGFGFTSSLGRHVAVRKHTFPDYLLGSMALHEWIHRFLELRIHLYHAAPLDGSDEMGIWWIQERSGLATGAQNATNTPVAVHADGTLLNELANYAYQVKFLEELVQNDEPTFQAELADRNARLGALFKHPEHGYLFLDVSTRAGEKRRIFLEQGKIHFDTTGNMVCLHHIPMFGMMQLAEDLAAYCGQVNGVPFEQALLQAKIAPDGDPHVCKLERAVDARLGQGFFTRLRHANILSDDWIHFLVEVQDKLYTMPKLDRPHSPAECPARGMFGRN